MKVKGANFFELHVEKIVLAVVAAVFVLVLVVQLGAEGPSVTVNNQKIPLEQAYEPAENLAGRVRTGMNLPEPELPEVDEQVDLLGRFRAARTAELAPRDRIVFGPSIRLAIAPGSGASFGNDPLVDLEIPSPTAPVAHAFAATLDPWAVQNAEGLSELLPPSQPYDKAAVSVQATFNSAALAEALGREPEGDRRAWPISWWRGALEILAVRLERQRLNPDGSWGDIEQVPPPPGALDIPAELAETPDLTPRELKSAVEEVRRTLARQVRRPDYYPIIAGDPWVEPREGARLARLEAGEDPAVAALQRRLTQIDQGIERGERELAELGAGPAARPGAPRPQQGDARREGQIRRIEGRLEGLRRQREQAVAELTALGHAPEQRAEPEQVGGQQQVAGRPGGRAADPEALISGAPIEVWGHDVTAEPGATYRYRIRLEFNNPAFGQSQFLIEEQRHLAEDATVDSQASPWSEPVMAPPMTAFFVTSGNEAQQGGAGGVRMASAGVEVFTFRYGYYRRAAVSLEPGDPVAAWAELPEGLPIFNVNEPPPMGGPAMPAPLGEPDRRERDRRAPDAGDVLPTRALAAADAYLVDVFESSARDAAGPVQSRAPRVVTFGDAEGRLLRRLVGDDRRSSLYGRLSASAAAGRTQGQPEPEPEAPEQRRRQERPELPPDIPPGGGGGGG